MSQTGELKWKYEQGSSEVQFRTIITGDSERQNDLFLHDFQRLFPHTEKEQMQRFLVVSPNAGSQLFEPPCSDVLHSWSVAPYCTAGELPKMKNICFAVCNSCREGRQRFHKEIQTSK